MFFLIIIIYALLRFNSNRGANAYNPNANNPPYNPQFQDTYNSLGKGGMVPDLPSSTVGGANSDGSYEKQLIEDLCEPGGTKAGS
jgi:hypothetical protein